MKTIRYTLSRVSIRTRLDRMGVTRRLPAYGRKLIVDTPGEPLLTVEKAYDTGGRAWENDSFVITETE